jgi:hypothetical protein
MGFRNLELCYFLGCHTVRLYIGANVSVEHAVPIFRAEKVVVCSCRTWVLA